MVFSPSVNLALLSAAMLAASTNGHAYMTLPLPTWPVSWATNSYAATIEGDTYLPVPDGMSYSTDPYDNTEAYWTAFNASDYTSLKDLITQTAEVQTMDTFGTATLECGYSLANGTARDLPADVEWTQLTSSHEGPLEIWCDDTLVFEDWNAAYDYTTDPAVLPYDSAACAGASMLTSYWLALHGLPWQVYINCAPLTGDYSSSVAASAQGDASSTTSTTTSTTTTTTSESADTDDEESASTESDASFAENYETSDDASGSESESDDATSTTTTTTAPTTTTATPTATTATPTATTEAPTATTSTTTTSDKCSVRRNRN